MGKNSSKLGGLKIELDSYNIKTGDKITGKVHMLITKELPPSELILIFRGVERTSWSERQGKATYYYYGKHMIIKVKKTLYTWNSPLVPCNITIPFKFVTPKAIPGSFEYITSWDLRAFINYYFTAFIKVEKTKIKDKQGLFVSGNENYKKLTSRTIILNVNSCCCIKKGHVTMNVRWINFLHSTEQPIDCILEIDNKSQYKIKSISVTVFMQIMVASGHQRYFNHIFMESDYYIPVKKGGILNGENGGRFSFDLNKIPNFLDTKMVHTLDSNIINCHFYVTFKLNTEMSWFCCENILEYTSLFYVLPKEQFTKPIFCEIPDGWDPILYNPVEMEYDILKEK